MNAGSMKERRNIEWHYTLLGNTLIEALAQATNTSVKCEKEWCYSFILVIPMFGYVLNYFHSFFCIFVSFKSISYFNKRSRLIVTVPGRAHLGDIV